MHLLHPVRLRELLLLQKLIGHDLYWLQSKHQAKHRLLEQEEVNHPRDAWSNDFR